MSQDYEIIAPTVVDATLMEQITRAEVDIQISTAKRFPRSIKQFVDDATEMVTLNETVAESCNYALPRAGKIIEGPSARFAELIYGAWGNLRAGARVIHEDGRFITAQGICHDLQKNIMITFEVKRRITGKGGKKYDEDMISVTGNAAASIALRNAILKVVPKAFWFPIYEQARKVALGDSKTLVTRRADALSIMLKFGVTAERILSKFELKGVEDITIEHLATLKGCAISIRDGEATAEELFPEEKSPVTDIPKSGADVLKDKLEENAKKNPKGNQEKKQDKPEPKSESKIDKEQPSTEADNTVSEQNKAAADSDLPPERRDLPRFDIEKHDITTQGGTKKAADSLLEFLKSLDAENRQGLFEEVEGHLVYEAMSRHGLGMERKKFGEMGIKI